MARSQYHQSPSHQQWNRALVTGATAGIGKALATELAAAGTDLVLVARTGEQLALVAKGLEETHGVSVEVLVADLGDEASLRNVVDRLGAEVSPVDLLVNNAGFGFLDDFITLDIENEQAVIALNVLALHRLCHAAGTAMATRGRGGILNVSSVAAYYPSPRSATYAATKAFVTMLSEALHVELKPRGVVVTCLAPGLTRTEFHERARLDVSAYPDWLWQRAETVAAAGLRGLAAGKVTVIPGAHNRLFTGGLRVTPGPLRRFIEKRVDDRVRMLRVPFTPDRLE